MASYNKKLIYRSGIVRRTMLVNLCHVSCKQIRATFHEVWELERFQTAKVTFRVIGNGAI